MNDAKIYPVKELVTDAILSVLLLLIVHAVPGMIFTAVMAPVLIKLEKRIIK